MAEKRELDGDPGALQQQRPGREHGAELEASSSRARRMCEARGGRATVERDRPV